MIIGKNCEEVLPIIGIGAVIASGEASTKHIVKLSDSYIAMNKIPVWVEGEVKGAVITCQDITQIQETEEKIRQTLWKRGLTAKNSFGDIIGRSAAITEAIHLARKYGETGLTVLIHGESGTGKELFAQSIHNVSKVHMGPFVALNCATIPKDLLESTLFGYEDGAFTGAIKGGKKGVFELANNGTLFLDEITEMDISTQANFLRVLQEKEIMRIGGDRVIPVSVRIVCASNKSLKNQVEQGLFREDLFYRLNVLALEIPPLRDRKGDILLLTRHFSKKYSERFGKGEVFFPDEVIRLLDGYSWPGNVRQLENVIQKVVIVSDRGEAEIKYIQSDIFSMQREEPAEPDDLLEGDLDAITRKIVMEILRRECYNKTQTAKRLGITRATLNSKIQ
jgi:transcriptional regulator with PAS, ATPase and Fis domain